MLASLMLDVFALSACALVTGAREIMKPGWFKTPNSYETTHAFRRESVQVILDNGVSIWDELVARSQVEVDFPKMDSSIHERVFKILSNSLKAHLPRPRVKNGG
eukprot:4100650-Pyramimonas_sp.AAC.1